MQPIVTGCPQTQMRTVEAGTNTTAVTWTEPTASDASGFVSLASVNFHPGHEFPVGVTEVEYVFVDLSANRAICSFDVEVTSGMSMFNQGFSCNPILPLKRLLDTWSAHMQQVYSRQCIAAPFIHLEIKF